MREPTQEEIDVDGAPAPRLHEARRSCFLVCDPFAGSGTTGIACIKMGRRFLGWEKKPEHFAYAERRMRAAREQLELLP